MLMLNRSSDLQVVPSSSIRTIQPGQSLLIGQQVQIATTMAGTTTVVAAANGEPLKKKMRN
jgi:hypothetical protein